MIPAPYPWRCIRLPPCPEPLPYGTDCPVKVLFLTVCVLSFTANAAELLPAVVKHRR